MFSADWDTDTLAVSEDYYRKQSDGQTVIQKETYELTRNKDGKFELEVALRGQNGEDAIYFIQGETGVYALKIVFADDEAAITAPAESPSAGSDNPVESKADSLSAAITSAILDEHKPAEPDGLYHCASFIPLKQEELYVPGAAEGESAGRNQVTVYGMALHQAYGYSGGTFHDMGGSHIPTAITFEVKEGKYTVTEYWIPRDGGYYVQDIRDKFPDEVEEDAMDTQKYILAQKQNCYDQAVQYGSVDTDTVIEGLLEQITGSDAALSSGAQEYIAAHVIEYRELTYYGKYTLQYCFQEFLKGGQTDLRGLIMAEVCQEIIGGFGEALLLDYEPANGQEWFEAFQSNAKSLQEQYTEEELQLYYPGSWLLLEGRISQDLLKYVFNYTLAC